MLVPVGRMEFYFLLLITVKLFLSNIKMIHIQSHVVPNLWDFFLDTKTKTKVH